MAYSRKRCRHCGRSVEQVGSISRTGSCPGCSLSRMLAAGRAAVELGRASYQGSVDRDRQADRDRYRRDRAAATS